MFYVLILYIFVGIILIRGSVWHVFMLGEAGWGALGGGEASAGRLSVLATLIDGGTRVNTRDQLMRYC